MRMRLVAAFGTALILIAMVMAFFHFSRKEREFREQVWSEITAARAKRELNAGRHIVLDCVQIQPAK